MIRRNLYVGTENRMAARAHLYRGVRITNHELLITMKVRINPSIFREYDIRGVVGRDITPDVAGAIARGYATYIRSRLPAPVSHIPVVVGRDNRESSPWIRDAVVEGLAAGGCGWCWTAGMALPVSSLPRCSRTSASISSGCTATLIPDSLITIPIRYNRRTCVTSS